MKRFGRLLRQKVRVEPGKACFGWGVKGSSIRGRGKPAVAFVWDFGAQLAPFGRLLLVHPFLPLQQHKVISLVGSLKGECMLRRGGRCLFVYRESTPIFEKVELAAKIRLDEISNQAGDRVTG